MVRASRSDPAGNRKRENQQSFAPTMPRSVTHQMLNARTKPPSAPIRQMNLSSVVRRIEVVLRHLDAGHVEVHFDDETESRNIVPV